VKKKKEDAIQFLMDNISKHYLGLRGINGVYEVFCLLLVVLAIVNRDGTEQAQK
jgi:hypothetical protein